MELHVAIKYSSCLFTTATFPNGDHRHFEAPGVTIPYHYTVDANKGANNTDEKELFISWPFTLLGHSKVDVYQGTRLTGKNPNASIVSNGKIQNTVSVKIPEIPKHSFKVSALVCRVYTIIFQFIIMVNRRLQKLGEEEWSTCMQNLSNED